MEAIAIFVKKKMEIILIILVAFAASLLTFFSGFGLGTLLAPVFMLFFPVEVAIALTAVVHFFNNLFKLALVARFADKQVLLRFGVPAVAAAFAGSWLLFRLSDLPELFAYNLQGKTFEVSPINFTMAIILLFFAMMDLLPFFKKLQFGRDKMLIGGLLSGFFGGLSGNQGALRTAFLVKAGLSKEAFIGTGVAIAAFIDITRLSVYASKFEQSGLTDNLGLVAIATLSAMAGALTGNKLLKKVTLGFVQAFVAVMLILISLALGAGLIG